MRIEGFDLQKVESFDRAAGPHGRLKKSDIGSLYPHRDHIASVDYSGHGRGLIDRALVIESPMIKLLLVQGGTYMLKKYRSRTEVRDANIERSDALRERVTHHRTDHGVGLPEIGPCPQANWPKKCEKRNNERERSAIASVLIGHGVSATTRIRSMERSNWQNKDAHGHSQGDAQTGGTSSHGEAQVVSVAH